MRVKALSLLYHRVNECIPDPWTLCVSPAHFAEQMDVVTRLTPRPVITFDDGYADNLHNAMPILERYDVSAKVFVISGFLGSEAEMWWDALDQLYSLPEYFEAFNRMRRLQSASQMRELERLFALAQFTPQSRPDRRMMTADELVVLAGSPLVEIGAHTMSHPVLSLLTAVEQSREICGSKRELQEVLNKPVNGFAYPNGMRADYSCKTIQAVHEAGFGYSYSAYEHNLDHPLQLPRVMIRDWDGDEFSAALISASERAGIPSRLN